MDALSSHPCLCLAGTHYLNMLQHHMQDPSLPICSSVAALSYRRIRFARFVFCFPRKRHMDEACLDYFLLSPQRPMDAFSSHLHLCLASPTTLTCCSAICRLRYSMFASLSQHRHIDAFCLQEPVSVFRKNVIWTRLVWTRFLFSQPRPMVDVVPAFACLPPFG